MTTTEQLNEAAKNALHGLSTRPAVGAWHLLSLGDRGARIYGPDGVTLDVSPEVKPFLLDDWLWSRDKDAAGELLADFVRHQCAKNSAEELRGMALSVLFLTADPAKRSAWRGSRNDCMNILRELRRNPGYMSGIESFWGRRFLEMDALPDLIHVSSFDSDEWTGDLLSPWERNKEWQ